VLMSLIDASMCTCECFCFCKLMINVEEVMYCACYAYKCIIKIISIEYVILFKISTWYRSCLMCSKD